MWDFLERLFAGHFMPHGHCYLWSPVMVWMQVLSNALIGTAYVSISATLVYLVRRVQLPFSWVYVAFGTFILACGMTHFLDIVTVWHPIYWLDGSVRVVTAIASVGTALLVVPLVPRVFDLSQVSNLAKERKERLELVVKELTETNERLRFEEQERTRLAAENARLEERMRTQEFQERFLAILGHDLRNPLAAIEMGAALLRQTSAEKDLKILNRMDTSSRRMSRMIEQILDLTRSRLESGLAVVPVSADLTETLSTVVEELRVAYPGRHIELQTPPSLPGKWDRDRLEQVFSNLVGNAIQHGSALTPVTVRARSEAGSIVVEVHNDGPPIPEDLRSKLFDPFRRGDRDSRTSRTAGLGLGLFISREIVTAHGGTIEVRSTEAEGTTFRVVLLKPSNDRE